jgi:hypothetical protein
MIEKLMNIQHEYSHHEKQETQQFGYFRVHKQNEEEFWNMSWNSKKRWNISEADEIYKNEMKYSKIKWNIPKWNERF